MTDLIQSYEAPFKDWSPGRKEQWKRSILKNILEYNRYPISVEALIQGVDLKPESVVNTIFGILNKSEKNFPIPSPGTLSPTNAQELEQSQEYAIFLYKYYFGKSPVSQEKKEKAKSFISSSTSFRPGRTIRAKVTTTTGIIPKRGVPKQIAEAISKPTETQSSEVEGGESVPKGVVNSLGRLSLNLEQSNNDLEAIISFIKDDYKNTREINRKEIEEYRKRIANRGRIIGKKELGSDKLDLAGLVKQYVGTFFTGAGGALRALSGLNIVEGIMTGDVGKIFGGLTGITASYIPAIGMAVGGKIAASLGERLFLGRRTGGTSRGFGGIARGARPLVRGGGRVALGAGLLAGGAFLGSKIFGGGGEGQKVQDLISTKQGNGGSDVLIPRDALERFDKLNKKFEQAIDRLLAGGGGPARGGSGGGVPTVINTSPGDQKLAAFVASMEAGSKENAADVLQVMLNRAASGYSRQGLAGVISGKDQFTPISAAIYGTSADPNAAAKYGPISSTLPGRTPQEKFKYLQDIASQPDGLSQLQRIFGGGSAQVANSILTDPKLLEESRRNIGGSLSFRGYQVSGGTKVRPGGNVFFDRTGNIGSLTAIPDAPTLPAPTITPTSSTPRNLPAPGSTPQQSIQPFPVSSSTNSPSSAAIDAGEGPPPMDTTYPENFLALYSKLIYQIV